MRTNEELNRIIAEWCGMKETETEIASSTNGVRYATKSYLAYNYRGEEIGSTTERGRWMPGYCTDLNAIHEAEKKSDWASYINALSTTLSIPTAGKPPVWALVFATARQRAEALVKVIESK